MLSEEEKKAIEVLIYCLDKTFTGFDKYYFKKDDTSMMIFQAIKIAINLIENQQKEIEQQAKEIERQDRNIHKLNLDKIQQQKEIEELKEVKWYYEISRVPKAKIKAKIEEYNKMINATYGDLTHYGDYRRDVCIEIKNVLQSLLEEE